MSQKFFKVLFLFILGSYQAVQADIVSCAGALRIESPLAKQYRPYSGFFSAAPPWKYAKALLNEPLPIVIQVKLEPILKSLEDKKIHNYFELARRFKTEPKVFNEWNKAREQFSLYENSDDASIAANQLRSDLLIYNWIIDNSTLSRKSIQEAHEASMGSHVEQYDRRGRAINVVKGMFRSRDVYAGDGEHICPRYQDVPMAIDDFLRWYHANENVLHPLLLAAHSYRWLISIQPFRDGNKRTARVIADWILIKNGFPPLTAPIRGFSLSGLVFGNVSYEKNERPWEFFDAFFMSVNNSLNLENKLQSTSPNSDPSIERP